MPPSYSLQWIETENTPLRGQLTLGKEKYQGSQSQDGEVEVTQEVNGKSLDISFCPLPPVDEGLLQSCKFEWETADEARVTLGSDIYSCTPGQDREYPKLRQNIGGQFRLIPFGFPEVDVFCPPHGFVVRLLPQGCAPTHTQQKFEDSRQRMASAIFFLAFKFKKREARHAAAVLPDDYFFAKTRSEFFKWRQEVGPSAEALQEHTWVYRERYRVLDNVGGLREPATNAGPPVL
ncbi:hypothetical protein C8R46DRAFT_1024443 [Mycena filopes]|nr:hypothetical protein C8R46DRAFT_1024443 [Mycena filopes]